MKIIVKEQINQSIENLRNLFDGKTLIVPPYQRAYAWEKKQLEQFVSDLNDKPKDYYYGHFILEKTNDDCYEIIDGQQRITTFILFLLVCRLYEHHSIQDFDNFIRRFKTVDYDQQSFETIIHNLNNIDEEWSSSNLQLSNKEQQTFSIGKIIFALNYFRGLFRENKKLEKKNISNYVSTLIESHISTHITYNKAVAVQIFELQNSRGVKLNLIEKVKAKLMKAAYLNYSENDVKAVQDCFACIYKFEESTINASFKGDLTLDELLLLHLRVVDDGYKMPANGKSAFSTPSKSGDREENILNYLDKQIKDKKDISKYVKGISESFKKTVELLCIYLPEMDKTNPLIGDVLILERSLSLELFMLLFHKHENANFLSDRFVRVWEKFLFIRDFHDRYYRQVYRDDFENLFYELGNGDNDVNILDKFLTGGFRPELMESRSLPQTSIAYIQKNKNNILSSAYNWWQRKMVYILYKFELESNANRQDLRKIMKDGVSIEHILPQEWSWEWVAGDGGKSEQELRNEINGVINGIGNLLLILGGENSSASNNHPNEKHYNSCSGGSYELHNGQKDKWKSHLNWKTIIDDRGNEIFKFLLKFVNNN